MPRHHCGHHQASQAPWPTLAPTPDLSSYINPDDSNPMADTRTPVIPQQPPIISDLLPEGVSFSNPNTSAKQDGHSRPFISDHHSDLVLPPNFSFVDQSLVTRPASVTASSLKQRRRNFLTGLSNVMSSRGTPLPPSLTGVPYPNDYEPSNSPWKSIESSSTEIGCFRLADRDVDLFKLWGLVLQAGGSSKLNNQGGWGMLLSHFGLPEQFRVPQPNNQNSVASVLSRHYMSLLYPFEDAYKKNVQDQQRRAILSAPRHSGPKLQHSLMTGINQGLRIHHQDGAMQSNYGENAPAATVTSRGRPVSSSPSPGSNSRTHHRAPDTSLSRPPSRTMSIQPTYLGNDAHPVSDSNSGGSPIVDGTFLEQLVDKNMLDPDIQGIKRKLERDVVDGKRVRQRIAESELPNFAPFPQNLAADRVSLPSSNLTSVANPVTKSSYARQKIEYTPFYREINTFGGRDLKELHEGYTRLFVRRPFRDINDWGNVDIDALTMSIRSRLDIEVSYALTTFTMLSTMKGQTQGSGFPIFQCADLLDELLDLLEDELFDSVKEISDTNINDDLRVVTHRELVSLWNEEQNQAFASPANRHGSNDPDLGSLQRHSNIILTILNILRNLSTIPDNISFIAQNERLLDLVLRVCNVVHNGLNLSAASVILSLRDLITVRKDVLYTLSSLASMIQFRSHSTPSARMVRVARRTFALVASFLVDPAECVSPLVYIQQIGFPTNGNLKPPSLPDVALDVFTRLSQCESNRQAFSRLLPPTMVWRLFESLIHRLPILDADFQLLTRELWLSHLEKVVLAIYSLAFLASPMLKLKVKTDRNLAFTPVMLRMVQKFLTNSNPDGRLWFSVCSRRAIEAMKIVDDGEDCFDTSQAVTMPTLAFGMGYGEVGDCETEEGTGMLGGRRDAAWDLLMLQEVDDVMFAELESLARVG